MLGIIEKISTRDQILIVSAKTSKSVGSILYIDQIVFRIYAASGAEELLYSRHFKGVENPCSSKFDICYIRKLLDRMIRAGWGVVDPTL